MKSRSTPESERCLAKRPERKLISQLAMMLIGGSTTHPTRHLNGKVSAALPAFQNIGRKHEPKNTSDE
jgi:hypothetical protein